MIEKYLGKLSFIAIQPINGKGTPICLCLQFSFDKGSGVQTREPLSKLKEIMKEAMLSDFSNIPNIPVEIEMEDKILKSWRVLTEVI